MKLRKTGLVLSSLYILICVVFIAWSMFITDPKSKFVLLQIPVVLQHGILLYFGLTKLLSGLSWALIYVFLALPFTIMLYFIGHGLESLFSRVSCKFSNNASKNVSA